MTVRSKREKWTRVIARLLPKENLREPFGFPKLKVRSPSHIFRSPALILRYQPGIKHLLAVYAGKMGFVCAQADVQCEKFTLQPALTNF